MLVGQNYGTCISLTNTWFWFQLVGANAGFFDDSSEEETDKLEPSQFQSKDLTQQQGLEVSLWKYSPNIFCHLKMPT